jgi:hypothetical protein
MNLTTEYYYYLKYNTLREDQQSRTMTQIVTDDSRITRARATEVKFHPGLVVS